MAPQGRQSPDKELIKPLTRAQVRAANKPANAVPADLKPVKRGAVTKWVKK